MKSEGWRMRALHKIAAVLTAGAIAILLSGSAGAAVRHSRHRHGFARHRKASVSQNFTEAEPYKGALVEDADSGKVLYEFNADMPWPPASMAKMMLLLVADDQIRAGRLHLTDQVVVSYNAAHTGGERLGLHTGDVYPLGELMKAALIKSANDAA